MTQERFSEQLDFEKEAGSTGSNVPPELTALAEQQSIAEEELLAKQHVVGVAIGHKVTGGTDTNRDCLTVLVDTKVNEDLVTAADLIPPNGSGLSSAVSEDLEIDVQEVGVLQAGTGAADLLTSGVMDEPEPPTATMQLGASDIEALLLRNRVRPARGGYSVGHYRVTAGTIATGCYDWSPFPGIPSRYYLLSNNHVLANSNNARLGDPILQPGPYDGGRMPADVIGRLSRFVPIRFGSDGRFPCNYVDAAIAEVPFDMLDRQIYWIGYVKRLYDAPYVGEIVQKTGRTTNFTTGRVTNINATVLVNYGGRVAKFCRQIVTTRMGGPGDSGSLITDRLENGVGLLFAGSSTRTIANHLNLVQALLRVRVTEL